MKELWKSFKLLFFFLIFPVTANSFELSEYGLDLNNFSELKELRTVYVSDQSGELIYIDPENDTNNLSEIKDFQLNINFSSDELDKIYQFCCKSNQDTFLFVGTINNADEKFISLTSEEVLNLDNQIKVKNFLVFENNKLNKSLLIKDDKYNLLQINSNEQEYTLFFNSTLKFKDTISSVSKLNFSDFSPTDFNLQIVFTPSYINITDIATRISLYYLTNFDFNVVFDNKSNKVIYTDRDLKKIRYHGDFVENADISNPASFLKPTLLNFLPTELKKILDKGREINLSYQPTHTFDDLQNLIKISEKINSEIVDFAKRKESDLESIIQKKQAELKAEEERVKAEELKAAQLDEQKAEEERQRILDQQAEEEKQIMLTEQAVAEAEEKRKKYIKYGSIIILIGGLIAFIFLTNFLDNLQKFLKQIFSIFKKNKLKSYISKDYEKKKKRNKKILGDWIADWANDYENPSSALYISIAICIVSFFLAYIAAKSVIDVDNPSNIANFFYWSFLIVTALSGWTAGKIFFGIKGYSCPKCKRIYSGEVYSSTHIGSQQRARKYRVRDNRTIRYKDHRGFNKTDNYTVERDETGVEQIDNYHNKAKCKLCGHKWEYNSSTSTRVR